jgi:hypothetical protein
MGRTSSILLDELGPVSGITAEQTLRIQAGFHGLCDHAKLAWVASIGERLYQCYMAYCIETDFVFDAVYAKTLLQQIWECSLGNTVSLPNGNDLIRVMLPEDLAESVTNFGDMAMCYVGVVASTCDALKHNRVDELFRCSSDGLRQVDWYLRFVNRQIFLDESLDEWTGSRWLDLVVRLPMWLDEIRFQNDALAEITTLGHPDENFVRKYKRIGERVGPLPVFRGIGKRIHPPS